MACEWHELGRAATGERGAKKIGHLGLAAPTAVEGPGHNFARPSTNRNDQDPEVLGPALGPDVLLTSILFASLLGWRSICMSLKVRALSADAWCHGGSATALVARFRSCRHYRDHR